MGNLTGGRHMADLGTFAGDPQYTRPGSPVEARQEEVAREYLQRAEEFDRKPGTPDGVEGPMTKGMKPCGSRLLVPVIGTFAEMSSDVDALADATASALAADHIQFFSTSAAEAKGMYKQRIRTVLGPRSPPGVHDCCKGQNEEISISPRFSSI